MSREGSVKVKATQGGGGAERESDQALPGQTDFEADKEVRSRNKDQYGPLMDHEYDGIRELDNVLPPWWVNLFYITIVFACVYFSGYAWFFGYQDEEFAAEQKAQRVAVEKLQALAPKAKEERGQKSDAESLAKGKRVFAEFCASCHAADGGGNIGPNLTDAYWLYGNSFEAIATTIAKGVVDKGMPNWGGVLADADIDRVASFILSLKGTNPAKPKEPQGEKRE